MAETTNTENCIEALERENGRLTALLAHKESGLMTWTMAVYHTVKKMADAVGLLNADH